MTTLVGIDNITSYTVNAQVNSVSGTRFIHLPFVASQTGTATDLYLYITTATGHVPNIKMGIYANDGTQLGITSSVLVSGSPGWVSAALGASVAITSGTTYKLGWIADNNYTGYRTTSPATDAYRDGSGTYASPPATITSTLDGGIDNFAMYADGTTDGPATLSSATPSGTLGTATSATLGASTDQTSGTLYGVVDVEANITGISAAQVKAAQNNASASPVASGNASVSTGSPSVGVTGLTADTAYGFALVQNNTNGDSNVLTGSFTTAAPVVFGNSSYGPKGFISTLLTM